MKRIALILMLVASSAFGGEYKFIPGTQVTATVVLQADANGELTIVVAGQTITIGVVTTVPIPKDPTDPNPDPTDPLALKVAALVASAPMAVNERRTVAEAYRKTGEFQTSDPESIRKSIAFLFGLLPLPAEWKTWKAKVDSFAGSLGIDDVKRAWVLIADGLVNGLAEETAAEAEERQLQFSGKGE